MSMKRFLHSRSEPEDAVEEKRDWKAEKKSSDESNVEGDEKEEDGSKTTGDKSEEKGDDGKTKSSKDSSKSSSTKRNRDGIYDGIPTSYLICNLCNKRMWDGESFEKHLWGKAHQQIVDSVENSFKLKCNMMRESLRLEEEKRDIEMNRMKRSGKNLKQQQLSQCNMCDLQFHGHLMAHRRSAGHQRLKAFLHPRCKECNKEFSNRMEWTSHNMTPEHLLKVWQIASKEGKTDIPVEKTDDADETEVTKRDEELFEDCDDPEPENAILDLNEVLTNISARIPIFKSDRVVSESSIKPVSGFYCDICPCFVLTVEERQRHLKSHRHFNAFITELNKKAVGENRKKKKSRSEGECDDDEGNWKRRKMNSDASKEDENKDDSNSNEANKESDLYDPSAPIEEPDPQTEKNKIEDEEEEEEEEEQLVEEVVAMPDDTSKISDDVWAEVDNVIDNADQDANESNAEEVSFIEDTPVKVEDDSEVEFVVTEERAPESEEDVPVNVRVTRRGGGHVRNGAGPKSKTRGRKSQ